MLKIELGAHLPTHPPQNLTVATTGASGSIFLKQLLLAVERDQRVQTVNFIASDSALRVMAEEFGLRGRSDLVGQSSAGFQTTAGQGVAQNPAAGQCRYRRQYRQRLLSR